MAARPGLRTAREAGRGEHPPRVRGVRLAQVDRLVAHVRRRVAELEALVLIDVALERAGRGRTVILIAHRLSTVQKADKILVLKKGVVVETGIHNQLLEQNGRYLDLWTLQRSEQAA
mgnify:CR=1 FL=1